MKKILILILLFSILHNKIISQTKKVLDENTKMLIFTSVERDGNDATKSTMQDWLNEMNNHFEFLKIENTSILTFYKPLLKDSIRSQYKIQLFKIPDRNSQNQSRYLIWYKDFENEVWLRAAGYVENDLHFLFNNLAKQKIRNKKVLILFQDWIKSDTLFTEIDLKCLFKGYMKGKSKSACFRSVYYIKRNDLSIGYQPLDYKSLNSINSRLPLFGRFK